MSWDLFLFRIPPGWDPAGKEWEEIEKEALGMGTPVEVWEKLLAIPGVIDTTDEHGMTVQFQAADGTADVYGLDEDPVKDLMINIHGMPGREIAEFLRETAVRLGACFWDESEGRWIRPEEIEGHCSWAFPHRCLQCDRHYPRGVPRCSYCGGQVQPDAGTS